MLLILYVMPRIAPDHDLKDMRVASIPVESNL
jgi:hypothetical protein